MKKQFFYAALAITLMSSCSKDNEPVNTTDPTPENPGVIDDTKPAEIRLGIGTPTIASTRGTGSVGDLAGEAGNVWNGQTLSIYMFEKGTVKQVMDGGNYIFDSETFRAPFKNEVSNTNVGAIKFITGNIKYYPVKGQFDFYGYHLDTDATPTVTNDGTNLTVEATIDGTNDVMAATTYFTSEDSVKLINAALKKAKKEYTYTVVEKKTIATEGTPITNNDETRKKDLELLNAELAKAYSAYAARREVQPNLLFKHMLARLKFNVFAGEAGAAIADNALSGKGAEQGGTATPTATDGAAYIESIKITGVPTPSPDGGDPTLVGIKDKVVLTVAPSQSLTATISSQNAAFTLKEKVSNGDSEAAKELKELTPTAAANFSATSPVGTPVGESIMIVPGDQQIYMTVAIRQFVQINDGTGTGENPSEETWAWKTQDFSVLVNAPKDNEGNQLTFEQGKSYNINITVYGFQKIEIDATLEGWISGGDIPVDPEDF